MDASRLRLDTNILKTQANQGIPLNAIKLAPKGGSGPVLKGQAGVNRAIAEIEAAGGQVLGTNVSIVTALGRRVQDIYVQLANGVREFVEVKNGSKAALTTSQAAKDAIIRTQGGVPVGAKAARAGFTPGAAIPGTNIRVIQYK